MLSNPGMLTNPYGHPELSGTIKSSPMDFEVSEQLGFEPGGAGEHLFLYVQKTNLTTHEMIEQLAGRLAMKPRDIGYSGLKDKHAITRQWLSLHLPGAKQKPKIEDHESYQVLRAEWHDKKLRVGVHRSNEFNVIIRDVKGQSESLNQKIVQIRDSGFVNYFGQQRFGQQQDNVEQAIRVLNNRHKLKRLSRNKKSLYISALRSELFNQIMARRIQQGIWQQPIDGDAYMLAGTQSVFTEDLSEEIIKRYHEKDIHCGISLYGIGMSRLQGEAERLEQEVIHSQEQIKHTLEDLDIKRSLRSNRALVDNFYVSHEAAENIIRVQVTLGKGSYLTTLLNHFIHVS
jgi:tRNA pseudouridine13 synthase